MLAAAFRHLGSGLLANAIIIAAVVAAWKSEPVLDRVIPPSERMRVTSQIPVTMTQTRFGDTIQVDDHQRQPGLAGDGRHCLPGLLRRWQAPSSTSGRDPSATGTGSLPARPSRTSWPRNSTRTSEIASTSAPRAAGLTFADFRPMPAFIPSFRFEPHPETGHPLFVVTNDTPAVITGLWFSCIGTHGFREAMMTSPAYRTDLNYRIRPGATLALRVEELRYDLHDCRVYAVKTQRSVTDARG